MSASKREMINRRLDEIGNAYNADFDIIPDGPRVTWVDAKFVQICTLLLDEIGTLVGEGVILRTRVETLENIIRKHNLG